MEYSSFVRQKIKAMSKGRVRAHMGALLLANLFAYLLGFLLCIVILAIIYVPVAPQILKAAGQMSFVTAETSEQLMAGVLPYFNEIGELFLQSALDNMFYCMLMFLLMFLLTVPLHVGIQRVHMDIARGKKVSLVKVFEAFSSFSAYVRAIKLQLAVFFRLLLLWFLPFAIMFGAGMVSDSLGLYGASSNLFMVLSILIGARLTVYKMGWVCALDNPSIKVNAAVKQATRTMKGQYGNVLVFNLSFILWTLCKSFVLYLSVFALLEGAVGGLLVAASMFFVVFVESYQQVSTVALYDHFRGAIARSTQDQ